jgi:coproporphyrinogen III oxidase-like Fe-S oxidoreductase
MLVRAGVNRLSLGAQSFLPAELAVLERAHAPAAIAETLKPAGWPGCGTSAST